MNESTCFVKNFGHQYNLQVWEKGVTDRFRFKRTTEKITEWLTCRKALYVKHPSPYHSIQ